MNLLETYRGFEIYGNDDWLFLIAKQEEEEYRDNSFYSIQDARNYIDSIQINPPKLTV